MTTAARCLECFSFFPLLYLYYNSEFEKTQILTPVMTASVKFLMVWLFKLPATLFLGKKIASTAPLATSEKRKKWEGGML